MPPNSTLAQHVYYVNINGLKADKRTQWRFFYICRVETWKF